MRSGGRSQRQPSVPLPYCERALLRDSGKRQPESRSLPDGAVAIDSTVVLADDAVGNRQAETGTLADGLGRKERIIDARDVLARNPRSRIGDFHDRAFLSRPPGDCQPAA